MDLSRVHAPALRAFTPSAQDRRLAVEVARGGRCGRVVRVQKWRVTTDDSIAAAGADSRNEAIDRDDLGNVSLPTMQQLARAVAIVRATAECWLGRRPAERSTAARSGVGARLNERIPESGGGAA